MASQSPMRFWRFLPDRPWLTGILAVLWIGGVWVFYYPDKATRDYRDGFAFKRSADSMTLIGMVGDSYAPEVSRMFRFTKEAMHENAVQIFDHAFSRGRFPAEAAPHWALLFHELGDSPRARRANGVAPLRLDEENPGVSLLADLVADESPLPPAELEDLASYYRENATAMPEWMLLARHHDDEVIEEWLVDRADRLLRRGIAADVFGLVMMVASLVCAGWFLFKGRKSPPIPRSRPLERSWSGWRFAQEFLTAQLLGLFGGMLLSRPLYAAGSPGLAMFLGSFVQGAVTLTWLFSTLAPGFRFGLAHFLPESRTRKHGSGGGANFSRSLLLGMTAFAALTGVGVLYSISGIGLGSLGDVLREESLDWVPLIVSNLIIAVVIAPVVEEIVFRGFLHGALRVCFGPVLAAVPGSLLFAMVHGYSIPGLFGVFLFGLVFTWIYERSGSLLPGMIAHSLFNLVIVSSGVAWYSLH